MPLTPDALRRHLLEELLPLWRDRAVDRERGGFHGTLTRGLEPRRREPKRLLVHTRLIHAFSHASVMGAPGWALEAARHGVTYLRERFRDRRHGGFHRSLTPEGEPLDRTKDLYDHAFVLFALAHYARASGQREALAEASDTFERMERGLAAAEGFFEAGAEDWKPLAAVRRQNPHMHLLEACLALGEAAGELGEDADAYRACAARLVELFRTRFFDAERGCLGELFNDDWRPQPGDDGLRCEPGHHFEWVWLLHRQARATGDAALLEAAGRLFAFASRHGIDPEHGGVYDEVDREGRVLCDTKRLWPQAEYVKALAARLETGSDPDAAALLDAALEHCFARYVDPDHRGWHEHLSREGAVVSDHLRATSVYHVVFALSEAMRVRGA